MKIFVWTNGISALIGVLFYARYLSTKTYPRTEEKTARGDVIGLLLNMALLLWATVLLFR